MSVRIASGLDIPVEIVTQTVAILAKRGAGKTHTAVVLTEELLKAGQQVVVLDPLDVWFGLRSSVDGKRDAFPITILGGEHGDLQLDASAGTVIADFVVEHRTSVILSMRHFSMSDQRRFVTEFCERLYHKKGEDKYRQPMHVIIDEADEFVPQRIMAGQERMFGSIDRIVRRGRASGLGVTLISQRAAVVNKDVLTQIEMLICLRTISPQDRKALEAWIEAHDAYDQRKEFMGSLASLEIGTAWIWSPGWLDIFKKVKIRQRKTFDSSATPKIGDKEKTPTISFAVVDIPALRKQLEATIQQAKADDPKELRRRIAELEKQLRLQKPSQVDESAIAKRVGVAIEKKAVVAIDGGMQTLMSALTKAVQETSEQIQKGLQLESVSTLFVLPTKEDATRFEDEHVRRATMKSSIDGQRERISQGAARILTVLAQYQKGATKKQVALIVGYAVKGGAYNNYLSWLRSRHWIEGRDRLGITADGMIALGPYDDLPTGRRLFDYWCGKLGKAERSILTALEVYSGKAVSKVTLAISAGYEAKGGAFNNALSKLRTLQLIEGSSSIRLAEELL